MAADSALLLNHHVVGRRIVAALIDGLVIGAGFAILAGALGDIDTGGGDDFRFHLGSGPVSFYVIASLAYFTLTRRNRKRWSGTFSGSLMSSLRSIWWACWS